MGCIPQTRSPLHYELQVLRLSQEATCVRRKSVTDCWLLTADCQLFLERSRYPRNTLLAGEPFNAGGTYEANGIRFLIDKRRLRCL